MTNNELARQMVATGATRFEEATGFRPTESMALTDAVEVLIVMGNLAMLAGDTESAERTADRIFELMLQCFAHEMMLSVIGRAIEAEIERAEIIAQYGPEAQA